MLDRKACGLLALVACPLLLLGCGSEAPPAVTEDGGSATTDDGGSSAADAGDRNPLLGGGSDGGMSGGTPSMPTGGAGVPASDVAEDGSYVIANGLRIPVPEGWTAEPVGQTSMNVRLGQMRLDGVEGPEGVMAVTGNIGGGVEANIGRWISQIREPVGEPVRERVDLGDGLTLHTFRMEGAFHPGAMSPNAPVLKNMLSLGAIVSGGPRGEVFFKLTAPTEVIEPHEARWDAMLRGIERAG